MISKIHVIAYGNHGTYELHFTETMICMYKCYVSECVVLHISRIHETTHQKSQITVKKYHLYDNVHRFNTFICVYNIVFPTESIV